MCDVVNNAHVHAPPLHFHVVAGQDLAFPTWGAGENVMKAPPYHFQIQLQLQLVVIVLNILVSTSLKRVIVACHHVWWGSRDIQGGNPSLPMARSVLCCGQPAVGGTALPDT